MSLMLVTCGAILIEKLEFIDAALTLMVACGVWQMTRQRRFAFGVKARILNEGNVIPCQPLREFCAHMILMKFLPSTGGKCASRCWHTIAAMGGNPAVHPWKLNFRWSKMKCIHSPHEEAQGMDHNFLNGLILVKNVMVKVSTCWNSFRVMWRLWTSVIGFHDGCQHCPKTAKRQQEWCHCSIFFIIDDLNLTFAFILWLCITLRWIIVTPEASGHNLVSAARFWQCLSCFLPFLTFSTQLRQARNLSCCTNSLSTQSRERTMDQDGQWKSPLHLD